MTWLAPRIEIEDNRQGYIDIVDHVRKHGKVQHSQHGLTVEVRDATIVHYNPRESWPWDIGRKFSPALASAETLQLIAGIMDDERIQKLVPAMGDFAEPNGKFWGGYGPRTVSQMGDVLRKLKSDPDSRQAVAVIWDQRLDGAGGKKDHPCTLTLQFAIRDDQLLMTTSMRSNDLGKGWAHDLPVFTGMQQTVARSLDLPVGPYVHKVFSLHIYEEQMNELSGLEVRPTEKYYPEGVGLPGEEWFRMRDRAVATYYGRTVEDATDSEIFYMEKILTKLGNA